MLHKKLFLIYLSVITFKIILSGSYAGTLDFYGRINEIYDDNVTYSRDNKKQDYITMFSLGFGAVFENKIDNLNVNGKVNQQIFEKNYKFNNNSQDVALNYQRDFSKYTRIKINDNFYHLYEPRNFEDAFGRVNGRYSTYRNKFSLVYAKDITKELIVSSRYMNDVINYSNSDLEDSYLNSAGLEGGYILNPFTELNVSYDYFIRNFYSGGHSLAHSLAFGIRKYISKRAFLDGKTGIDFLTPFAGKKIKRNSYMASLTNEIDKNNNAVFSFLKQYTISSFSPDIFDQWKVSGDLNGRLSERMYFSLSAFYGRGEYISTAITDKNTGSSISFDYDIKVNMKGRLSYTFSNVESTSESRGYSKNTVSAGINAYF